MIAGTIVTIISIPVYAILFRSIGAAGLAIASDIGILIQTLTLAILLHRRGMVSFRGLEYVELLRSLLAAVVGYIALLAMRHFMPQSTSRLYELALLALAGAVWIGVSALVLKLSGSALPDQLLSRFAKANR
jgi:putative peptidoglycan lipid II flippase